MKTPMTKEQAVKQLKILQSDDDKETAHMAADEILCKLLISLGYEEVVTEYNKIEKWFA